MQIHNQLLQICMEYSFLQEFSSLIEVYTAIYVSMFLDNILKNIWTPEYKQKISNLIKGMNIPAIGYFVKKVEDNIDANAEDIRGHMKRKALFFLVLCISLLLLSGLETHSRILQRNEYLIVSLLSVVGLLFILMGRWAYSKYSRVAISITMYSAIFATLYYPAVGDYIHGLVGFKEIGYKIAVCSILVVISFPIVWQIFLIWIYSSLYKGYMQEKITKEAYIYGKAYIAYKIKDMAALPMEYEMVAKDFVAKPSAEEDMSLNSLNIILVRRLETLCELPNVFKVFGSWIRFVLRGRHNYEAEYIEQNGFDYENMNTVHQSNAAHVSPSPTPKEQMGDGKNSVDAEFEEIE